MSNDREKYTIEGLRERIAEEIKEYEERGLDPEELSNEIADSLTPIWFTDCYQLCNDYPEIGQVDIEPGICGSDFSPARVAQIGVYEWISQEIHECLKKIKEEREANRLADLESDT